MNFLILAIILSTPLFASSNCEVSESQTLHVQEKGPLLIYFSNGEDSTIDDVRTATENHFGFIKIDLSKLTEAEKQKKQLEFNLQELPRIVVLDGNNEEIGRLSINHEKIAVTITELFALKEKHDSLMLALPYLYAIKDPVDLENLYHAALELKKEGFAKIIMERGCQNNILFFLVEKYRHLSKIGDIAQKTALKEKIISLDKNNEKEAIFSLALIDFQTLTTQSPSKEAVRPLEEYIERYGDKDHKNLWRIEMMIAQFYLNYDDWASSLKHAEVAFEEAPQELKAEIGTCKNQIKGVYENLK